MERISTRDCHTLECRRHLQELLEKGEAWQPFSQSEIIHDDEVLGTWRCEKGGGSSREEIDATSSHS